jgi:hypothetical protein
MLAFSLLPFRHINHPSSLHQPPLNRLRKLIQYFQRRHLHTRLLALSQRLTQQILKLDEIALSYTSATASHQIQQSTYLLQILLHTWFEIALQRIHIDSPLY